MTGGGHVTLESTLLTRWALARTGTLSLKGAICLDQRDSCVCCVISVGKCGFEFRRSGPEDYLLVLAVVLEHRIWILTTAPGGLLRLPRQACICWNRQCQKSSPETVSALVTLLQQNSRSVQLASG